jgi:hypothetical protein
MLSNLLVGAAPGFVLLIVVLWGALISTAVITPFVLVSVARSLRGIQRELAAANGRVVPAPAPDAAAGARAVTPAVQQMFGH